jgi:hypothetical protein
MVRLSLGEDGSLVVTVESEPAFSLLEQGFEIALSGVTSELSDKKAVFAHPGRIAELSEHVVCVLQRLQLRVEFDSALERLMRQSQSEASHIAEVRASPGVASVSPELGGVRRPLLEHQRRSVIRALTMHNPADFSVPGSGKTAVALSVFADLRERKVAAVMVVIGPASCFEPWEAEFHETFRRRPNVVRWTGSAKRRKSLLAAVDDAELVLCTYQTACRDAELLEKMLLAHPTFLVLDESHYIKNFTVGVRASVALRLAPHAVRRMVLSGTPVPHSLLDLWTQMTFLWPSGALLGTRTDYESLLVEKHDGAVEEVTRITKPFFIRVTKSDLGLPDPVYSFLRVPHSRVPPAQRRLIELLELQTLAEARTHLAHPSDKQILKLWRAARVIRLLQASVNPALLAGKLVLPDVEVDAVADVSDVNLAPLSRLVMQFAERRALPAKVKAVAGLARRLIASGKKVIVWTWFVDNLRLLAKLLEDSHPMLLFGGIRPYAEDWDDEEEDESRERNIHLFKTRRDRPILLANPAACAESISLHKVCHDAVYLDRSFNCGQFLQSLDRIHRVGLPLGTETRYHIAFLDCAIERTVDRRLRERQSVMYRLMDDPMPILGLGDDQPDAGSLEDIEAAYDDVIGEIERDHAR